MDTIQDTPEETFGSRAKQPWLTNGDRQPVKQPVRKPRGKPFSRQADWRSVALVGASVAAGAALGAAIALLWAPQSGAHTRLALARELRSRRPWKTSPWEQLGDELRKAARRRNQAAPELRDSSV